MGLYDDIVKEYKKKKNEENAFKMPSEHTAIKIVYEKQKKSYETAKKDYETALNKEYIRLGGSLPVKQNDFLNANKNKKQNSLIQDIQIKQKANEKADISEKLDKYAGEYNKYLYADYLNNQRKVKNEKTTLWDKTGGVITRGISDLFSSATDAKYIDENGKQIYLPSYSQLKQEKVRNDYDTDIGKFLGDVGYNATKIGGSMAMDALLPGSGSAIYWQDMFADSYKNAVNQGYDSGSSAAYALVNVGFEYGTGKLLGGATGKLTGGSSRELDNALSNAAFKLTKNPKISRILGTAGSEGTEEFVQEYLDNLSKMAILDKNTNAKDYISMFTDMGILEDALYSAGVGAASGGFIEGSTASNVDSNIKMFETFKEQLEQRKKNTADIKTREQYDNIINNIDEYLKKPFSIDDNITDNIVNNAENVRQQEINNEVATNAINKYNLQQQQFTLPTIENTNPLQNLQEFNQKQQEIRNQQIQEDTNNQIKELQNQVEELQKSSFNLDENATQYNDLQQSQNIEFSKNTNGDIKVILKDTNGNVINDFTLISEKQATKSLGNEIGNYILNNANNQIQSININQNNQETKQPTTFKEQQLDIINKTNPMNDELHVGIRNIDDIKTFEEAINDDESFAWGDYNKDDALRDLQKGTVMVYSSYPIENGNFVSTSYQQAYEYAGHDKSKVYSKEVPLTDVAWINGDEEQYAKVPTIPTAKDFNKVNLPTVENNQNVNNGISQEVIDRYENATGTIDRNTLLEVADTLDIHYKEGSTVIIDENMSKRAGHNTNPKIIDVSNLIKNGTLKEMISEANTIAENLYTKNENGYTMVNNIDTNSEFEIGNKGIGKTFSKNVPLEKIPTANKLLELGEQAIYYRTSFDEKDGKGIKHHHFLVPVKAYNAKGNAFVRMVVREYTNRNDLNNKFYYHQIEYLDNQKEVSLPVALQSNEKQAFVSTSSMDNDTIKLPKSQVAPLPSQYNMQQNKKSIPTYYRDVLNNMSKQDIKLPKNPTKESSYEDTKEYKKTRKTVQEELKQEMGITLDDIAVGKDISSLDFQRTDPIRLNEKVFGVKVGQKINDATINKTKHNEAERTRFLNKERDEIAELDIKPRSKESTAVQKYGEKQFITDKGDIQKYGDAQLAAEFPDIATQNKIKHAAEVIRNKYDKYIDQINNIITELGYDPIPKRPDYMRHFQEINDKLSQWGIPLNPTDMSKDTLPTDINGITDQFKPGKNWFASAMQRKGLKTTYDAITGIDGYLEGASNLMYHTEDIQRYRTLSKFIRDTYGQTHGMDNIDVNTEEGQNRLNDIFDNKLSKYAAWLDEQANALAGKKGGIDRAAERLLGRKVYTVLDTAKKQVGSNMTGFNVRSALTNFASAVQGASKTNKVAFIKGTMSTLKNIIHNDGMIDKSDFLTNRFGSDQLSKKFWQKASNAGQILMTGSDYFTANQIWRSKYYENLDNGMNESQAIKQADDFAARIMGDRSKGSTAEIFNSKTLGLLTQFQLEVNNQWSSIIHDNKIDIQSGNKSGATVVFQLGQLAAMSYFFNNFMKSLTGSDVMIDPIDMLKKILGGDDDEDKTLEERATDVIGDIWNNLPFASFMTGGRIPVGEAFKGGETLIKYATGQKNSYGQNYSLNDVKKDLTESAYYWLLPTGYGQARKTTKGLSMYDKNLPMPGSYTNSGNLRFRADESTGGKVKAALFGQYSSKEAQNYMDSGYKAISKSRIQEIKDLDMQASEYRKYREGLNQAGTTNADKIEYIANSDYSNREKNIMAKNILGRDFSITEYNKYDSYEEYDYATKYPDKYSVIKQIAPYDKYTTYKAKITDIRNNTTDDKNETIKYINSLNMSIPQKAMFIKQYYKSFKQYDKQIIEYINSQKMTVKEKEQILTQLGFTVRNGRVY